MHATPTYVSLFRASWRFFGTGTAHFHRHLSSPLQFQYPLIRATPELNFFLLQIHPSEQNALYVDGGGSSNFIGGRLHLP